MLRPDACLLRAVLTACAMAAVGCGSPIAEEVDEYAGLVNEGRKLTCVCFASDQTRSTPMLSPLATCDAAQGNISDEDQQCMLDALDGQEDAAKAYLDRTSPVLQQTDV